MMTEAEKLRIVTILNRVHRTSLTVHVVEIAVKARFTTWEILKRDAEVAQARLN